MLLFDIQGRMHVAEGEAERLAFGGLYVPSARF